MEQVVAGSYADVLMKEGEKKAEAEAKAEALSAVNILCTLFKELPTKTNAEIAVISRLSGKYVSAMRTLLQKNTRETAVDRIVKSFFDNIKLTEQDKKKLTFYVGYYYGTDILN